MYRAALRIGAAGALLLCLFGGSAVAQTGLGTVKGTVLDPSRSAISGAKATLTNRDTNIARNTESSNVGIYYFGEIPPGRYTLAIEAPGFKKWSGTLVLQVGQTAVIDPLLEVGSVETIVEVQDVAPVINTEGMQVADVKDALRIDQLPLNGRSIANLFNLTPGVEGGGSPRVNGLKVGATEMLLDGISIVDRFGGGISRVQPGLDTIQEFRIETSGSNAQYSRPATVALVTKSGTNQLHGGLFETFRNNGGGLRTRRRQETGAAEKLIRNEFGGTAGGPVFLPGLYDGRNKSFWFFSYEGLRQRQANFDEDYVPTAAMWDGDFTQAIDNNNVHTHIYDPLTTNADGLRTQFTNDTIPKSRMSPILDTMRSVTHLPTNPTNPFQGTNMRTFYPQGTNIDNWTVKGDHRFSNSDTISGRFTRSHNLSATQGGVFGSPREEITNGFGTSRSDARVYSTSLRETHLFSPSFINEVLVANHRSPKSSGTLADFTDWPAKLGLPNPFGAMGWPTICAGNDPWSNNCWDADNRKDEMLTAYVIEDNMTKVAGKHTFRWGGKIRREYNNVRELQQSQGSHDFGEAWTALYDPEGDEAKSFTGIGLASMALGLPTFLSNQYNRGYFYFQQWEIGLYAQDTWKVSRRLTLDLGLRWGKWTPYTEKYNRQVNVDLRNFANKFEVITPGNHRMEDLPGVPPSVLASWQARGLTWRTADDAGLPSKLIPGDNNNFGPRIGAAYKLTDKTVVRAGFGEYYWTMPLSQILQTSRTNPPLNLRFSNNLGSNNGRDSNFAVHTAPTADNFIGRVGVPTQGIVPLSLSAQSMMPWDFRDWRDNRAESWHFTIEREIMKSTALRLSYIGDHGRDLEQRLNINARPSEYNYVLLTGQAPPSNRDLMRINKDWNFSAANHTGYSNTHTVQAEVERRYSSGLAFQWFYVFTRSLTTTDAGGFTSGNGNINSTDAQFLVPETAQILGNPNSTYDQRLRLGYQNSANIPAHHIRWNGIYDLPFGKGKRFANTASRALNMVVGGWQLATIGDWRSGNWLSVNANRYLFGDPTLDADQRLLLTFNGRPQRLWFRGDFDPRLATNVDQQKLQALVPVDRNARVYKPLGTGFDNRLPQALANGSTRLTPVTDSVNWNARAFFKGPGAWNVDASVFKNVALTERYTVRFTADFFNALNHPNDPNPNNQNGLQDLSTQPNDPRIIQLSLRFQF